MINNAGKRSVRGKINCKANVTDEGRLRKALPNKGLKMISNGYKLRTMSQETEIKWVTFMMNREDIRAEDFPKLPYDGYKATLKKALSHNAKRRNTILRLAENGNITSREVVANTDWTIKRAGQGLTAMANAGYLTVTGQEPGGYHMKTYGLTDHGRELLAAL